MHAGFLSFFGNNHEKFGIWEFTYKNSESYTCANTEQLKNKIPSNYFVPIKPKDETSLKSMRFVLTVVDETTGNPIVAVVKVLKNEDKSPIIDINSDLNGKAFFSIPLNKEIIINISKKGYMNLDQEMTVSDFGGVEITKTMKLKPVKIGESIILKNVLFKQGTALLLDSSYLELDKLIVLLKQNSEMEIELSGHTDNQGSQELNLKLSENRIIAVKDYLIQRGIGAKRIQGKGYGGLMPLYENISEATRRLNRRVEFKITKL